MQLGNIGGEKFRQLRRQIAGCGLLPELDAREISAVRTDLPCNGIQGKSTVLAQLAERGVAGRILDHLRFTKNISADCAASADFLQVFSEERRAPLLVKRRTPTNTQTSEGTFK